MKQLLHLLLLLTLASSTLVGCSATVAGGGADIGNPTMVGVVLSSQHEAVEGVELYLLPSDYIATDAEVEPQYRTRSDKDGRYSFDIIDTRSYTLFASLKQSDTTYSLFRKGITSEVSSVIYDILEPSAQLKVTISETAPFNGDAIVMPGLPTAFSFEVTSSDSGTELLVHGIPRGEVAALYLVNYRGEQDQLTDSLVIGDEPVQEVEAHRQWRNFTVNNSALETDTIYEVFQDSRGVNWYGTFGNGIYNGTTWEQFSIAEGVPSSVILAIEEDAQGRIWCGTSKGAVIIDGSTVLQTDGPTGSVFDIYRDESDRLWFGTDDGAYLYDGTTWTHYSFQNSGIADSTVHSITSYENILYMGTFGGGISTYDFTVWDTLTLDNSGLLSNHLYGIEFDSSGTMWCATSEGITFETGNLWESLTETNSDLPHKMIWSIAVEPNGVVWAGTIGGTVRYESREMNIFTTNNSHFNSSHSFGIHANHSTGTILYGTALGATIQELF